VAVKRAVFVDKDGTLVENVPYNVDPARIRLAPGARECVAALHKAGFALFVVSNQPGVALGKFSESRLKNVEMTIQQLLDHSISGFYFCVHQPGAGCECRKPGPGLLQRAAREHAISLEQSWMVGDILDDVEAGRRAGCRTVLVDVGNETEWQPGEDRVPDCVVRDLGHAAQRILLTSMRTS
jgi:D-glycero-D-manno-heptose 1,7-bisphosphate phosphatase